MSGGSFDVVVTDRRFPRVREVMSAVAARLGVSTRR